MFGNTIAQSAPYFYFLTIFDFFRNLSCTTWAYRVYTVLTTLCQMFIRYSVGPHPVSSLHVYTFVVPLAFMVGAANPAGDANSSRAPGLTSGLQRSVNVNRGALLLVP